MLHIFWHSLKNSNKTEDMLTTFVLKKQIDETYKIYISTIQFCNRLLKMTLEILQTAMIKAAKN